MTQRTRTARFLTTMAAAACLAALLLPGAAADNTVTPDVLQNRAWTWQKLQAFAAGVKASSLTSVTIDQPLSVTYNTTTSPLTSAMASSLPSPLTVGQIDGTTANATTPPVIGTTPETGAGFCSTAEANYRIYAVYANNIGVTIPNAASYLQYTVTGGTTRRIITTRPASGIPAAATHWRTVWARAGDSYAMASYGNSTWVTLTGGGGNVLVDCKITNAQCIANGNPFACCTGAGTGTGSAPCNGYGPASATNTTGIVAAIKFLDGEMRFTTGVNVTPPVLTADNTRLKFGTAGAVGLSVDAGANFYNLLTTATGAGTVDFTASPYNRIPGGTAAAAGGIPEIVNICPSGCTYADLTTACSARAGASSTTCTSGLCASGPRQGLGCSNNQDCPSSTPIVFHWGAGQYATGQTCANLSNGAIIGAGIGVTVIDGTASPVSTGLTLGNDRNLLIANLSIRNMRTGIAWNCYDPSTPLCGGLSYLRDLDIDNSVIANDSTDCLFMPDMIANSEIHIERSRCVLGGGDGWTIGAPHGQGSRIYTSNNTCVYPGTYSTAIGLNRSGCFFSLSSFTGWYSSGNVIDLTAAMTAVVSPAGGGLIGYNLDSSGRGVSGGVMSIKGDTIRIKNNSDDTHAYNASATGIFVKADHASCAGGTSDGGACTVDGDCPGGGTCTSAATPWGTINVSGTTIDTDVPINVTDGYSQGLRVDSATTVVNLYGTRIRAVGGKAANRFDILGTTAGNTTVGPDTDFLLANQTSVATLAGNYSRNVITKPVKCNVGDYYKSSTGDLCECTPANTWVTVRTGGTCS